MDFNTLRYLQRANVAAYIREESEEQKAYSDLFDSILKKHGADSPNDLPDEKKDDFFNEVEREWAKHPKNKKDDGEATNEEWDKEDDEDEEVKEGWGKKKKMKEETDEEDDEEEKKMPFGEGWARSLAATRRRMMEDVMQPGGGFDWNDPFTPFITPEPDPTVPLSPNPVFYDPGSYRPGRYYPKPTRWWEAFPWGGNNDGSPPRFGPGGFQYDSEGNPIYPQTPWGW